MLTAPHFPSRAPDTVVFLPRLLSVWPNLPLPLFPSTSVLLHVLAFVCLFVHLEQASKSIKGPLPVPRPISKKHTLSVVNVQRSTNCKSKDAEADIWASAGRRACQFGRLVRCGSCGCPPAADSGGGPGKKPFILAARAGFHSKSRGLSGRMGCRRGKSTPTQQPGPVTG